MYNLAQLKTHIGQRIKDLRLSRRLTMEAVTVELNMAFPNYLYLEKGSRGVPKLETLCKLADFYDVSLDYFFQDYVPENNPSVRKSFLETKLLREFRKLRQDKKVLSVQVVRGFRN